MSLFDQRMGASSGALMHHNSDPLTYREPGREPVDLFGIVGYEETIEEEHRDGRKQRKVRDVTICTDPDSVYGGVAVPALNATVEIGDAEYAVVSLMSSSGTFVRLMLKQTRAIERSREGLRK